MKKVPPKNRYRQHPLPIPAVKKKNRRDEMGVWLRWSLVRRNLPIKPIGIDWISRRRTVVLPQGSRKSERFTLYGSNQRVDCRLRKGNMCLLTLLSRFLNNTYRTPNSV